MGDLSGTISVYADILPPYIEQIIVFVPTIFDRSMGDERLFRGGEMIHGRYRGFSTHGRGKEKLPSVLGSGSYPTPLDDTYTLSGKNSSSYLTAALSARLF